MSKEVVPQSDHINEQEFDALNDFNWFIPEWYNKLNRVEEYPGEELKNETFFMYGGGNPWYTLLSTSERVQSKFKIKIKSYNLIAKEMPSENFVQASQACVEFIKQIFTDFIDPIESDKKIRLYIDHEAFSYPINTAFVDKEDLTVEMILSYFESIIQSLKIMDEFEQKLNNKIKISIIIANKLLGRGKQKMTRNNINSPEEYFQFKKAIIDIKNNDNQCLLRAILIGKAYADNEKKPSALNRTNNKEMRQRIEYVRKKINLPNTGCGISEISSLENYFQNYQIMVMSYNYKFNKIPEYLNTSREFKKFIYLIHHNNHFYLVRSMKAFLNQSYFCDFCKIGYGSSTNHSCIMVCDYCKSLNCQIENKRRCFHCNTFCNSESCLQTHKEQYCMALKNCQDCNYIRTVNHVCGDNSKWCFNCKKSVEIDHRCYILAESENDQNQEFKGYIFFDFEAYKGEKNHIVNLAMAQRVCKSCLRSKYRCAACNHIYKFGSIEKFCRWSLKQKNTIQIAHNLKGYDGIFIFNYIIKNLLPDDLMPTAIINGTKIMQIKFRKIKYLDSHCFIPMPLSEFSSCFELNELKKGYFPHLFNTPENQHYSGKYPEKSYYESEYFSVNKKNEFDNWYERVKDQDFIFKKEFEDYCWSDVQLLTEGCLKFRSINMQDTGIDPFQVATTIASYCNYVFRNKFMSPNTIGIIPENGYNPNQKTSNKAMTWLKYLSETQNIHIKHAKNGGEVKCGNYFLDGVCEETKTIYEFHGK